MNEDIGERAKRLMDSIKVKPTSFLIYDVPYMGTIDHYMFGGMQPTKYGDIALYNGILCGNTICLSTIKELLENE